MATPTFDAVSTGQADAAASLTFSHTCSGANRVLLVGVAYVDGSTQSISGVTYNAVAMTLVGTSTDSGGYEVSLWRLIAPATGANNVVVTGSAAGMYFAAGAISFNSAHQTTPVGTFASATGNSTAPTVNVTSATDEVVVDALAWNHVSTTTASVGAGQTSRWNVLNASNMSGAGSTEAGAASVTMSWTLTAAQTWAIGAVSVKGIADPPPTVIVAIPTVELKLLSTWTDVTTDVSGADGEAITGGWGIGGNGPKDRIADVGVLTLALKNDPSNSAGLRGYYSPAHLNCRAGFTHGVLCRLTYTYNATPYARFYGKVYSIDPVPGIHQSQLTRLVVHDLMDDLVEADLRAVALQVDQTEAQLIATLIAALPAAAQPVSTSLDTGLDVNPYAFDTLGPGKKAIAPLSDLAISAVGNIHIGPSGILRYENRQARQLKTSSLTLADDMVDLVVPTSLDGVFNHIRVTYHPKIVDAAATTVLWSHTGKAPVIAPGETIEIWGNYYKPSEPSVKIGGTAQVTPVATTDYMGNAAANGSGSNRTSNLTVTATFYASTVQLLISHNHAATVYLVDGSGNTKLQVRGKGLYDQSPVTVESVSVQDYGDRVVDIDLPYQSDFNVAQDIAEYLRTQYETYSTQAHSVTFVANRSATHMLAAMTAAIGDRITISETQTGLTLVDTFINHILITSRPGRAGSITECRFGLAGATFFDQVWVLDDAALSILDTSTILGFA